ncbi:MAG TPA: ATP-dependent DNA ligase [Streptosporangiaceae bacterium]|nr:ATP-dependent DNA ligase [Streptosporangiaceae bacterium]
MAVSRMLLDAVVQTSAAVAASPGRLAKISLIAELLGRVPSDEIAVAVSFLSGDLTQRQIGVGYAALADLMGGYGEGAGPASLPEPPEAPALTLAETDQALGQIGLLAGQGSQAERRRLLAGLLARATEAERRFLVRLLAGDLRQGALDGIMTEAVASAAAVSAAEVRRAYQLGGSLPAAAAAALAAGHRGQVAVDALRAMSVHVGRPLRPMLAASAPTVAEAMDRISPAAVDWKIDGIRVQLHRQGAAVRVFTRTLDDITDRVPELAAAALTLTAQSAIVDGEAVALRPDGRPQPFQVTSARTASQPGASGASAVLTLFLFDLLHADGTDLIDVPASQRFTRLVTIAPAELVVPRLVTSDVTEAEQFFAAAIERGHEGVVIKSLDAPYGAGRRGSEWIKVKPRHTLDLLVLGAEWGHGRRQGWLSNLHLGARDPETGGTVMLGKTFKGLTDAVLAWQTERLLELADPPRDRPDSARRSAGPRGVVMVRPELVVEIALDGVQASTRYPGGVTLRFARVVRYRPDKSPAEADTIDTVRDLWQGDDAADSEPGGPLTAE